MESLEDFNTFEKRDRASSVYEPVLKKARTECNHDTPKCLLRIREPPVNRVVEHGDIEPCHSILRVLALIPSRLNGLPDSRENRFFWSALR